MNQRLKWKLVDYIWIDLKIPILNIYYLLCYAWNKLQEGQLVNVSASEYDDSINLFARVLVNGCRVLFKRGLDRNYIEEKQEYLGIKGKIDFTESINRNLFKQGKSVCIFDNFEVDVLQNQLLKATLLRLSRIKSLDKDLRKEVLECHRRFSNVSDVYPQLSSFSRVKIHRNNSYYDFLLKICQLVIQNTVLDEKAGTYVFKDFIGSEKEMAGLFESFVRNFYKLELPGYSVFREDIKWDAFPILDSSINYLPKMQTDVSIESTSKKIIIETKYYVNMLSSRFDSDKFISSNLYQLYSYLRNIESKETTILNKTCEGILLYPTVNYDINESFLFGSHVIKIKTVDLNKSWRSIKDQLLNF